MTTTDRPLTFTTLTAEPVVTIVATLAGSRYAVAVGTVAGRPFVALPDYRTAAQMAYRDPDTDYVAEKLRINLVDAAAVASILAATDVDALLAEARLELDEGRTFMDAVGRDAYASALADEVARGEDW